MPLQLKADLQKTSVKAKEAVKVIVMRRRMTFVAVSYSALQPSFVLFSVSAKNSNSLAFLLYVGWPPTSY